MLCGMQGLDIDQLEAPAPVHVRIVGLRCEAQACNSAASGLVPLELIAATGKRAGQRRAATCDKRAEALAKDIDQDNPAIQPLGSPRFQALVLALARFRVCPCTCMVHASTNANTMMRVDPDRSFATCF